MARRGNGNEHGWGKGPGWGGPARGAGRGSAKAEPFTTDHQPAGVGHNSDRRSRRQAMLDKLFEIATTAEREEVQVSASIAWLKCFEGPPRPMAAHGSTTDPPNLTDADLEDKARQHAARIQAKKKKD